MSTAPSSNLSEFQTAVSQAVRAHWKLFLAEGIILVILGVLAVVIPGFTIITTFAFTIFIGALLLVSGVVGLITTFGARGAPGFWWSLLSAILGIVAGFLLLFSPTLGVVSLTLLLIAFFLIEGVLSIVYAFEHKRELTGQWGWMLVSGIIDLILAAVIYAYLPEGSAFVALGLLVGFNMLFGGIAMIAMAVHARKAAAATPTPTTTTRTA